MTEQEKELKEFVSDFLGRNANYIFSTEELAKAIIQRYPQILAEKVWEGERLYLSSIFEWAKGKSENIEVFIREVVE